MYVVSCGVALLRPGPGAVLLAPSAGLAFGSLAGRMGGAAAHSEAGFTVSPRGGALPPCAGPPLPVHSSH